MNIQTKNKVKYFDFNKKLVFGTKSDNKLYSASNIQSDERLLINHIINRKINNINPYVSHNQFQYMKMGSSDSLKLQIND